EGGGRGGGVGGVEEAGERGWGKGGEGGAEGGVEADRAAGCGLLPQGRPAAVLGAAGEAVRDGVPGRVDSPGGGLGDQDPPADGQDAGGTPERVAGLLRRDDHEWSVGGDQQQDQDDEAASVWVPGPGILQAEDPGDP